MTRDKQRVALSSVLAAVFLTGIKLVAGIMTNSLGILAEALHSGLDLLAALVTLVAVRTADRPADERHPYGYGKVESLSALIESVLLFLTSGWVVFEAGRRLLGHGPQVEVSVLALGVMVLSIIIDFGRSRALNRVARKYSSQALEADALHFSTDIYSSLAVIAGLVAVKWLDFRLGDPLVALAVAVFVVFSAVRLVVRALAVLLDRAQTTDTELVKQSLSAAGDVRDYRNLRIRRAGSKTFVDLTIIVDARLPLTRAHEVSQAVEREVAQRLPRSDVVVHVEPGGSAGSIAVERTPDGLGRADVLRQIEATLNEHHRQFVGFHELDADAGNEVRTITFHLVMPEDAHVRETHDFCDHIEQDLRAKFCQARINIHVEPCDRRCSNCDTICASRPSSN